MSLYESGSLDILDDGRVDKLVLANHLDEVHALFT